MEVTVIANKGIGLDLTLAGGKGVQVPAGGSLKVELTGDQVGHVEGYLVSQARAEKFGPDLAGGKVIVPSYTPPKGSKAHRALHPEAYVAKEEKHAEKPTKGA